MNYQELMSAIAFELNQDEATKQQLMQRFPDPKEMFSEDDMWDGRDVCNFLEMELRNNRHAVDTLLNDYMTIRCMVVVDEMELSEG